MLTADTHKAKRGRRSNEKEAARKGGERWGEGWRDREREGNIQYAHTAHSSAPPRSFGFFFLLKVKWATTRVFTSEHYKYSAVFTHNFWLLFSNFSSFVENKESNYFFLTL